MQSIRSDKNPFTNTKLFKILSAKTLLRCTTTFKREMMIAKMNTTDNKFPLEIIPLFFFLNSKMFEDNDDGTIKRDHAHPSTRPDMKGYIKVSIDISLHEQTMHGLR